MLTPQFLADHEAVSRIACDHVCQRLREKPGALLCLASGGTPERTYELLAERGMENTTLLSKARWLKLDEWGGLPLDDPATCEQHLRRTLINTDARSNRYVGFDSQPADRAAECARIASWLAQNGPIDIAILGLGMNGHLGFNEPADSLQPHAHVATLSAASRGHAMVRAMPTAPTYGLTLGMADLLQAKQVLLLVTGEAKREPLRRLLTGQVTTQFPASMLQLHPNVLLACDTAASSR